MTNLDPSRPHLIEASVQGVSTRCLHQPGRGPTVVLLHGASGNAHTWRPVLGAWSWADVWCPDLPGRGGSPAPAARTAFEAAEWLADASEAFGWTRPVLAGHSFGGAVALSAALVRPEAWGGIALISSGARLKVAPAILEAVESATADAPFALDAAFGPGTDPQVVSAYTARMTSTPPETARADWRACDAFDVRDRLGEIGLPALVLHGAADLLTPPKHQARLADALPRATRVERPRGGHMLPWEEPDATAEAVRRAFSG